ncbi:MAG: NADH-quinone oxidoreductase subunit J [Candidatus Omnitrophota bacterium]
MASLIVFYLLALSAVAFAFGIVFFRKPIYNLLSFLGLSLCVGAHLVLIHCAFWGLFYVLVYAGAILVLFLFVLMLTPYTEKRVDLFGISSPNHYSPAYTVGLIALSAGFFGTLVWVILKSRLLPRNINLLDVQRPAVSTAAVITSIMREYPLALWMSGFLILTAVLGLAVFSRKDTA